MNYDSATDYQINTATARALGHEPRAYELQSGLKITAIGITVNDVPVDYCNSPGDAWPIIVENRINLITLGAEWMATYTPEDSGDISSYIDSTGENPLRAAMIVYLKMQEAGV